MKNLFLVIACVLATPLFASSVVVEDGCTLDSGCYTAKKYAQVCVVNPVVTQRNIRVVTNWNVGDVKAPMILTPGSQAVYRLALEAPTEDATFSVKFRRNCLTCGVKEKAFPVAFRDEATNDCSKLPQYVFHWVDAYGVAELELSPVVAVPVTK